jgi:RNA polymerase sigma-70 factor (ECF subfamily)
VIAHTSDSLVDAALLPAEGASSVSGSVESNVLALFDRCAPQLLRYVGSFGIGAADAEDVVQDTFLALFRHLHLRRDQTNLTGWLFQVAHNLALKKREQTLKRRRSAACQEAATRWCADPAPDPEARLMREERGRRLRAVFDALPERERRCLFLRAEGLTYRDIARALSVSLGSVSKAVSRALTRLTTVDGG